jgi:sugar phosphate isomerase/epimerase
VTITRRSMLTAVSVAAAAQAQRAQPPNWKPKLGVLCMYSDRNLEFVKSQGFTSMQLRASGPLDPDHQDDSLIASIKDKIQRAGIHVSSLAVDGNHIDPDPDKRNRQNQMTMRAIELAGKLGVANIGGQSGKIVGKSLEDQVAEIVRVYTEKYFPLCEAHKVRILWEPYAGGPNIGTSPVGWEALHDSPHVGLQFDPSHLVWQFMDPVQAAREFADKIYDVHLKDTEILWHIVRRAGIQPVNNARWWRFRVPGYGSVDWKGFFSVLAESGYTGSMNIENEDTFYYPPYEKGDFTEQFKRGFEVAHEFLKTLVPPVTA